MLDTDLFQIPDSFSGIVRLFPLPNLVMFPGIIQPLHLFELRYVQLVEDALAGDRLIAMAQLRPGWEPNYEQSPPIYSTVCVGTIITHSQLDDGRYNILLRGLGRARVQREIATNRLFRMAEVELVPCPCSASGEQDSSLAAVTARLRRQFLQFCRHDASLDYHAIETLLGQSLSLEHLVDLIAFSLDANAAFKQAVLDARTLYARLELVVQELDRSLSRTSSQVQAQPQASAGEPKFPPVFSAN